MGYAQKMVIISGHTFSASVIYVTRMTHHHTSMVYMGILARPAPRITAEMLWAKASAK